MKNSILTSRLKAAKKDNSIEIIEGYVLTALKGGEGCSVKTRCNKTKCSPNGVVV